MNRRNWKESLRRELDRLTLTTDNIRIALDNLEREESPSPPEHAVPNIHPPNPPRFPLLDRDGIGIKVGDRVTFLTKGKFRTTEGTVSRFSRNGERVFAIDANGIEIPRSPHNVRITNNVE